MTRPLLAAALLAALAGPAPAEEPVSPSRFRDFAEGHTLYFHQDGQYFGAESYGPDRTAVWQFQNGPCVRGSWRPHGGQICFRYEDGRDEVCWRLFRDAEGLYARLVDAAGAPPFELRVVGRDTRPLNCGGPAV